MLPNTPIELHQGWNMVAYFPDSTVDAPAAFRNIRRILIAAKDGYGNFYYPLQGFNSLPPLHRGAGYLVKVEEDGELIWYVP